MTKNICAKLRKQSPLIHCITNPISIMQCANAVLLSGARPIMAEHPAEVEEITESASALLLNFGNVTKDRLKAMTLSYFVAMDCGIPVVIDAVGVGCSELRRNIIKKLLCKRNPDVPMVIKGNYSEIKALTCEDYRSSGVDADKKLTFKEITACAKELGDRLGVIVVATGKKDIVTDGARFAVIENGTKKLGSITGTGCMLGAMCAAFLAVEADIGSIVKAVSAFGICGEKAEGDLFLMRLFDAIEALNDKEIEERMKVKWT